MKVLFIERSLSSASPVLDQIRRIGRHLEDYRVLALQVGDCAEIDDEKVINIRVSFFPKLEAVKSWFFCSAAMRGVKQLKQEDWDYDLIHAHFAYPDGAAAHLVSEKCKKPYVLTLRGSDILCYPKQSKWIKKKISRSLIELKN